MSLHVVYGAGPLGLAVARALLAHGHSVRLINRRGAPAIAAHAQLETLAGSALDARFNARVCAGAEAVYQCAATGYSAAAWRDELGALQAQILRAAAAAGARLVVGDNLYAYGRVDGPIREDTPVLPCSAKGEVRAQLAERVLAADRAGQLRAALVRASHFYGPHVRHSVFGERVFTPALRGKRASLMGNPDLPHSMTFIDDFGRAMALVGASADAMGQLWHAPNAPALSQRALATLLFERIGRAPRIATMGKTMLRIGGLFIPDAREMVEMLYQLEQPFVVDHSKFAARFGAIATPHAAALDATIDWYCLALGMARSQSASRTPGALA